MSTTSSSSSSLNNKETSKQSGFKIDISKFKIKKDVLPQKPATEKPKIDLSKLKISSSKLNNIKIKEEEKKKKEAELAELAKLEAAAAELEAAELEAAAAELEAAEIEAEELLTEDEINSALEEKARMTELKLRENAWNESGHLVINGKDWTLNNSLEFADFINSRFHRYRLSKSYEMDCKEKDAAHKELFEYQKFVKEYISTQSPYRGILLYYGLGAGKTRASIEIAKQFAEPGNMCLFISKAKLITNFVKELAKWEWTFFPSFSQKGQDEKKKFTQKNYEEFVIINNRRPEDGRKYLRPYGVGYAAYNAPDFLSQLKAYVNPRTKKLTNMVIVIDEMHNLVQKLANGLNVNNKNISSYYNLLIDTENCRIVALSGTPIINLPSELGVLFNILRGPIPVPKDFNFKTWDHHIEAKERGYFELFPHRRDIFNQYFVKDLKPINVKIFQNRIQGLVSYYSGAKGEVYPEMVDENGKPIDTPIVVKTEMSELQTQWYNFMRVNEIKDSAKNNETVSSGVSTLTDEDVVDVDDVKGSSFRVKSRMASNYGFPLDIQTMVPIKVRKPDNISELFRILDENVEEFFGENLALYSVKMAEIINKMEEISMLSPSRDGGVLIYSNFREVEGIALMRRALLANGYTEYRVGDEKRPGFDFYNDKRFAVLGSKEGGGVTQSIIDVYNSKENLFLPGISNNLENDDDNVLLDSEDNPIPYIGAGRIVKILLGTEMISEGYDLYNIRQVHIMEPHWNFVRIDQTVGRARRVCSHINLPMELWTFTAWIYLAVISPESGFSNKNVKTTDEIIYEIAKEKKKINDVFQTAIKESAVDCRLNMTHNNIKCMDIALPTKNNIHAYHPDLWEDINNYKPTIYGERVLQKQFGRPPAMLGNYERKNKLFAYFPELWNIKEIKTNKGIEKQYVNKYLVEVDLQKNVVIETSQDNSQTIIYLYDKKAAESEYMRDNEMIKVGHILIKRNANPIIIWK